MKKTLTKTIAESANYIADIVGQESMRGQRMAAGDILALMDLAAVNVAWSHCNGPVATLSFDYLELLNPIFHQDYIRFECHLLEVGNSSMVVQIDGFVKSPTSMQEYPSHSGIATLVAIKKAGVSSKTVPQLRYEGEGDLQIQTLAKQRREEKEQRRNLEEAIERRDQIDLAELHSFGDHDRLIPLEKTLLKIQRIFLPKNSNQMGTIFGGDILKWMDEAAVYTARQFTANFDMITIAIDKVLFLKPISTEDLVEMESRVVFVKKHTLDVEVIIKVKSATEHQSQECGSMPKSIISHSARFTIFNYDRGGLKCLIRTGLNMENSTLEDRKRYLKAQSAYLNWKAKQQEEK